ncbi:hypothetical protein H1164_08325 [Thermoactinomyces daqus]|uniref:Helix-turn-helix domain-containing protein n=1 Tax=Thermoactinomyces daqus TaxID=1329516 RepID=A0A7W1XAA1_9BACL|nr:hypothetical protein [Thermoactinomyces daqus]MBA4542906.1 hypothetical protein [Thermoactinomyces daqus]
MKKMDLIKQSVKKSEEQRKKLECGDIKFGMFPLFAYQKKLPAMLKKYKKSDARDAIVLYMFYLSMVCRIPGHELEGCAFPSMDQITKNTGVHRSRIAKLNEILVKEQLIEQFKIPYEGHAKNVYVPMFNF